MRDLHKGETNLASGNISLMMCNPKTLGHYHTKLTV